MKRAAEKKLNSTTECVHFNPYFSMHGKWLKSIGMKCTDSVVELGFVSAARFSALFQMVSCYHK